MKNGEITVRFAAENELARVNVLREQVSRLHAENRPDVYTGAHKTVILKITTGASVMQGWQRNNGYPVSAGYPLFFCRYEKQWIYSQLSAIMFLNQSYPIHSEIFSKNLKKV